MDNLISIVIPTKNEENNIVTLLDKIKESVKNNYEILVVDDSDNMMTMAKASWNGAEIIVGQRRGLGQAIIDGINASNGDVIVVMDADLSHNPVYITPMVEACRNGYGMAVGSRYCKGGEINGWSFRRKVISKVASLLAYPLTLISDNTSGFFAVNSRLFNEVTLQANSWKIMLEVLIKTKAKIVEVPIRFSDRQYGKSKFTSKQMREYIKHLAKLYFYKYRFLSFGFVGGIGLITNLIILYLLTDIVGINYLMSFIVAFLVAASQNYLMNKKWTFGDIKESKLGYFRYLGITSVTLILDEILLWAFTDGIGMWYGVSALLAVLVAFIIRYTLVGKLIWKNKNVAY